MCIRVLAEDSRPLGRFPADLGTRVTVGVKWKGRGFRPPQQASKLKAMHSRHLRGVLVDSAA